MNTTTVDGLRPDSEFPRPPPTGDTPWGLLIDDYCDAWNEYARVMGFRVHYEEDPEEREKLVRELANVRAEEKLPARDALATAVRALIRYNGPDATREAKAHIACMWREDAVTLDQPWLCRLADALDPPE